MSTLTSLFFWFISILGWYRIGIGVYIFIGWVPHWRGTTFYNGLAWVVEPFVGIFRKVIAPIGGVDFSPLVAILVLDIFIRVLPQFWFRFVIGLPIIS